MPSVTQDDCDARIDGVYEAIGSKLPKWIFTWALGVLIAVLLTVLGTMFGIQLTHAMNDETHIDPRYPHVTKEVFEDFRREQRKVNKEVLSELRKSNGTHGTP